MIFNVLIFENIHDMKKKSIKNLSLNKTKISKIQNLDHIKGGDTILSCIVGTVAIGTKLISIAIGTCDCPPPPSGGCDETRGCPSWNVACPK